MINRRELFTSIFNRKNAIKAIESIIPVDLPKDDPFIDIPELSGEMLYFEAMKLGIDPSTIAPGKLKQVVMDELVKSQNKQAPSDVGAALAGDSVNG